MSKVKICGVTNLGDARLAVDNGAWAIGLVFHRASPRYCGPEEAALIGADIKRRCEVAGVFVNSTLDEIARLAEDSQLTLLQMHGDEGPAFCSEARRRTGAKVIRAVRVRDRSTIAALTTYNTDYYLLDSHSADLRGGTGETFNWELASEVKAKAPIILSGGLSPDNVAQGIAVVKPFAVDVATGVEASPGHKDPAKVKAFFRAIRQAEERLRTPSSDEAPKVGDSI